MRDAELIDRLCGVTAELAEIIREQAEIIGQAGMVCPELAERREEAERELERIVKETDCHGPEGPSQ